MAEIPHAVLSDQIAERVAGRRLLAAVFLTFRFDPTFFEEEVLPVFLDIPLSQAPAVRLVQLEDALRSVPDGIAVYYDQNGLADESGSPKLDVRRIPIRHRTGIFHPKNIFALVEQDADNSDEEGPKKTLLVCSMSANLTRAGWWENVECCHIEEIGDQTATRLRGDLLDLLDRIVRRKGDRAADGHRSLDSIKKFLRTTAQREQRSANGMLHPHFYSGKTSFSDFLSQTTKGALKGMNVEVISPYFDGGPTLGPLADLATLVGPKEVRVFLPRGDAGEALCANEVYDWVKEQPDTTWATLPNTLTTGGKAQDSRARTVHAKVYRFFSQRPRREIVFVGSVNLTTPAHQLGGNQESGVLVELPVTRSPDWWLIPDEKRPRAFQARKEDEGCASTSGTKLSIRYWWTTDSADAYWDDAAKSPPLVLHGLGVALFPVADLPPRQWHPLAKDQSAHISRTIKSTSLLQVSGEGKEPSWLLVQEEGMSHRPSLLLELSPADILRYWTLLTPEQRAAFIEHKLPGGGLPNPADPAAPPYRPLNGKADSFFDRFAGIFLGFGTLERAVIESLSKGDERNAEYRLFGKKYDSLPVMVDRVLKNSRDGVGEPIDHYLIVLCARQLIDVISKQFTDFWDAHTRDADAVKDQLLNINGIRDILVARNGAGMEKFLDWFESWFLRRAAALEKDCK